MNRRNYKIILLSILVLFSFSITGSAKEEQKGSVRIRLSDGAKETEKQGVIFAYEKVADFVNGKYEEVGTYSIGIDFNKIKTAREVEAAAERVKTFVKIPDGFVKTDQKGIAEMRNLEQGIYLVYMSQQAGYEAVDPFLVTIPMWDEKTKEVNFHVDVIPKHGPILLDIPEAPQTNVDGNYETKFLFSAGCMIMGVLVLYTNNRKRNKK